MPISLAKRKNKSMLFPYPQKPDDWQTAYTREQAYRDSDKRSAGFVLIISSTLIILVLYCALSLLRYFLYGSYSGFGFGLRAVAVVILALTTYLLVQKWGIRCSEDFFSKLYLPPEGVDPGKVINYRLYGKTRLPEPFNMLSQFKYLLVKDGEIDKKDQWPAWMAGNIGGPILLIVFDGCALYLERGNRFSRVVGPGEKSPFLEWHETIKYVVDLRPKVKTDGFSVWTKDGIKIKLTVRIECRIGEAASSDPSTNLVYPFDPIAVKKAIERYAFRWPDPKKEPTEFTWVDAAWGQITSIIPGYIGGRMLDDLLVADMDGGQILSPDIAQKIFDDVNSATQPFGVFITDMQILKVEIPEEIKRLQEEYWKTERESLATIIDGQVKASNIRIQEEARAAAQRDIILAIADGLEKNKNKQFIEPLLLSLSGVLDNSLSDPHLKAYLAKDTLDTLEKLQKLLDKPTL